MTLALIPSEADLLAISSTVSTGVAKEKEKVKKGSP
jgi:hypothetical protein